jgi:hypothetical protein
MGGFRKSLVALLSGALVAAITPVTAQALAAAPSAPHYDHVFVVVEENHGFTDVIGNPAAPNLNKLAQQFGLATSYYGITHPSEPNYVALLGGSTFGVNNDNPYYANQVNQPSLISQLDQAGISWKAYLQGLPYAGYQGICYPAKCNGTPDIDPLYVSKHDGIQNFTTSLNQADWSRQVPIEALARDLSSGHVPAFNYVIPDECRDQHGDPPYCVDSGSAGDPQDQHLVATGDQYLGQLVSTITSASFWAKGNNAINIVYDEGNDSAGCCNANPGGGRVASIMVTSHGVRGVQDPTPYNHYSLLRTIQDNFGVGCLANTCDTANVKPMTPMLAVTGAAAMATTPVTVAGFPTPTPTPQEPVSYTTKTPSGGGWKVVSSPMRGTNDNSLGAIAASSPTDVWAVGNFLPDTAASNQDATLTLANHYDGRTWTAVPTPNAGPNFNTFFGVAASGGKAWAVGVHLNDNYQRRALIEAWDGKQWIIVDSPQPGSQGDLLFAASATSPSDVWAVGDQQGADGRFTNLVEHFDGHRWSTVDVPNPGSTGNHFYGVTAVAPDDVWAVGQQNGDVAPDQALIEHFDGRRWSVVPSPRQGGASVLLAGVAASEGKVWAVGEADDPVTGGHPLVEQWDQGRWHTPPLPPAGSNFTNLWSVTAANGHAWAVGSYFDPTFGDNVTLTLQGGEDGWKVVSSPNPGPGANVLGGVLATGDNLWAVGYYKDSGRKTLIQRRPAD